MRSGATRGSAAIGWAVVALCLAGCGPDASIRPNLVLVTADAVRPDWLVCYGGDSTIGAEACALGDSGALYEWAFATSPAGAPSAASLLTSTYPTQHRVDDDPSSFLPALGPPTLAERLRAGGYATAAFVSSPELNRSRHLDRGFDHYDDRASDDRSGAPEAEAPRPVGQRARDWVATARDPWFVWVHFADPHGPFGSGPPPGRGGGDWRPGYREALRRLDRRLSQLIAVLDADPGAPPGILLTALHGQSLGEDGAAPGHGSSLRPSQIRVPLLWRSPRTGGGTGVSRRIHAPVSLIDVAPTLLEAAGLRAPASFEGVPLPHSDAAAPGAPDRAIFAVRSDAVAVVRGVDLAIWPRLGAIPPAAGPAGSTRPAPLLLRLPSANAPPGRDGGGRIDDVGAARLREAVARLPLDWRREAAPDSGS